MSTHPLTRTVARALPGEALGLADDLVTFEVWQSDYARLTTIVHAGGVYLWHLEVARDARGRGSGTRALEDFCARCDREGLTATLFPVGDDAAGERRLIAWYARHGFVASYSKKVGRVLMTREPAGKGVVHG
jgi:GNAT superfamily N-acetyltransferase